MAMRNLLSHVAESGFLIILTADSALFFPMESRGELPKIAGRFSAGMMHKSDGVPGGTPEMLCKHFNRAHGTGFPNVCLTRH